MHPPQQGNHQTMPIPQNGYSRTQTLPHPARKHDHHHEMMIAAHNQHHQNMRPMGTHTLGRLPSHNHSPQHIPGMNENNISILMMKNLTFFVFFS